MHISILVVYSPSSLLHLLQHYIIPHQHSIDWSPTKVLFPIFFFLNDLGRLPHSHSSNSSTILTLLSILTIYFNIQVYIKSFLKVFVYRIYRLLFLFFSCKSSSGNANVRLSVSLSVCLSPLLLKLINQTIKQQPSPQPPPQAPQQPIPPKQPKQPK